jgi:hypothetical protein
MEAQSSQQTTFRETPIFFEPLRSKLGNGKTIMGMKGVAGEG